jgi:rhodanese-related sulfurtransferase
MNELISPQEVHGEREPPAPYTVIDVRGPDEYAAGHVPGAVNIPADQVPGRLAEFPRDRPVATY